MIETIVVTSEGPAPTQHLLDIESDRTVCRMLHLDEVVPGTGGKLCGLCRKSERRIERERARVSSA